MNSIPDKWRSVRREEYCKLQTVLRHSPSFIHVLGPHGSGRTGLVRDLTRDIPTVYVDANISGSVSGVMSSILRRLALAQPTHELESDSDDSDADVKGQQGIKSECTVNTPEDVDRLLDRGPKRQRKAADVANVRLIATARQGRAVYKRKLKDDFIDDSDSDAVESDGHSDQEESRVTPGPGRAGSKSSTVLLHILRLLHKAQQLRVRNESAFVQKLERVLIRSNRQTVLVIDNIDAILTRKDFDLDSTGAGGNLLRLLARLNEYLTIPSNLTILVISSQTVPADVSSRSITVHLHPYTQPDAVAIIARPGDARFDAFLKHALAVLYPAFSGNFALLRDTINRLYECAQIRDAPASTLPAKAKLVCAEELVRTFGGGDDTQSFDAQVRDQREMQASVKWLSKTAKLVLIAGYLAAHNPPSQDKVLFRTVGNARRNTKAATAFKKARLNADSIHIRAPVPFQLNRVLTIFRYVSGTWEAEAQMDAGFLFFKVVRELVQHGLFKGTCDDWLRGTATKLNCHAPLDLIEIVAAEVNVKLDEVLYG